MYGRAACELCGLGRQGEGNPRCSLSMRWLMAVPGSGKERGIYVSEIEVAGFGDAGRRAD